MIDELTVGVVVGIAVALFFAGAACSIYQKGYENGLVDHHDMVLVGKHMCEKCKEVNHD